MGKDTKIEWADHTASPWHGCTKVSEGCDNCYAAAMAPRNPGVLGVWGDDGFRANSKSFVKRLEHWNRQAEKAGKPVTVFPSLCDPFEDRQELEPWRNEMFDAVDRLPWVTLLLVTKRPENVRRMWPMVREAILPDVDPGEWYRDNVWLLTSVENQEQADKRIPHLLDCRDLSPVLGLSCEPLLDRIDLQHCLGTLLPSEHCLHNWCEQGIDWVIAGGESGPNARPMHPDWPRSLRDQCQVAGIPFFFKQWGEFAPVCPDTPCPLSEYKKLVSVSPDGECDRDIHRLDHGLMWRAGKKAAGRLLDGQEWSQMPEVTQCISD